MRLIDADALGVGKCSSDLLPKAYRTSWNILIDLIKNAPTIDAVPAEKYNELREAFVDYVCSGVTNPAPYCKNKCGMCVNGYEWCLPESGNCRGFNPDGERKSAE